MRWDIHYESTPERSRWWAVVLFYVVLLTVIFGAGWFATIITGYQDHSPDPAPSTTRQA